MPTLSATHNSGKPVKLLLIGESGSGKTGSLVSLVKAGYKLRILDLDNGLDALVHQVMAECPDLIGSISYMSFRDNYKATPTGPMIQGQPKAFTGAVTALDKWEDGSKPSEWGIDTILVIDSLTALGRASLAWARNMNLSAREPRQWYNAAGTALEDVIATATGESFGSNLIVITHIDFVETASGVMQGFASSIGKALHAKLPRYFNTMLALERTGQGTQVKRVLRTVPTALLTLKNPAPMKLGAEYPISDGLAKIFAALKS